MTKKKSNNIKKMKEQTFHKTQQIIIPGLPDTQLHYKVTVKEGDSSKVKFHPSCFDNFFSYSLVSQNSIPLYTFNQPYTLLKSP